MEGGIAGGGGPGGGCPLRPKKETEMEAFFPLLLPKKLPTIYRTQKKGTFSLPRTFSVVELLIYFFARPALRTISQLKRRRGRRN